jgi:hypothetical protein
MAAPADVVIEDLTGVWIMVRDTRNFSFFLVEVSIKIHMYIKSFCVFILIIIYLTIGQVLVIRHRSATRIGKLERENMYII